MAEESDERKTIDVTVDDSHALNGRRLASR